MCLEVTGTIKFRDHSRIGTEMEKMFIANTTAYWVDLLTSNGVPAVVAEEASFPRLQRDSQIQSNRMLKSFVDHDGGNVHIIQGFIDFEGVDDNVRVMAPRLGQHTIEILRESNISETEIEALECQGIISSG